MARTNAFLQNKFLAFFSHIKNLLNISKYFFENFIYIASCHMFLIHFQILNKKIGDNHTTNNVPKFAKCFVISF